MQTQSEGVSVRASRALLSQCAEIRLSQGFLVQILENKAQGLERMVSIIPSADSRVFDRKTPPPPPPRKVRAVRAMKNEVRSKTVAKKQRKKHCTNAESEHSEHSADGEHREHAQPKCEQIQIKDAMEMCAIDVDNAGTETRSDEHKKGEEICELANLEIREQQQRGIPRPIHNDHNDHVNDVNDVIEPMAVRQIQTTKTETAASSKSHLPEKTEVKTETSEHHPQDPRLQQRRGSAQPPKVRALQLFRVFLFFGPFSLRSYFGLHQSPRQMLLPMS